jgi:fatty-acyl-CoA synthase
MKGYWRKPDATAEAFDGEWYKTGDLGLINEFGELVLVDRKKNMLISGGVNVYPAEVEHAMSAIEGIVEVAIIGVESHRFGQEVVGLIYAPTITDIAELIAKARVLVGPYKAPKRIVSSGSPLPRNATNKIARTELRRLFDTLCEAQALPTVNRSS